MKTRIVGLCCAVAVLAAGCAKLIPLNGFEVYEFQWVEAEPIIRNQAAFDLNCPKEQLELTLITANGPFADRVGVRGCEKQIAYQRLPQSGSPGKWVANTTAAK